MRFKQIKPHHVTKKQYRQYSLTRLTDAYSAVKGGMSVRSASRVFQVPAQTLRDRVLGKIDHETVIFGKAPLLNLEEEAQVANHLKEMAQYGYGYSCKDVRDIATDVAIRNGKRKKNQSLTEKWFRGFIRRWPDLKVVRPKALKGQRASSTEIQNVRKYFEELDHVLTKYMLKERPHLIYNIVEKRVIINCTPPYIVAGKEFQPRRVISGKSATITIISSGSASGIAVPPFFVFPGERLMAELMDGASPGADATVSETGSSNSVIFRHYLETHFLRFAPGRDDEPLLLLLDGHKTHISVGLIEWAKEHNIIIHMLPAHTRHLLQPLDVGCFGSFQRIYNSECHRRMSSNTVEVTKHNIYEIGCKAYAQALSSDNLQSAFSKTGIYPFCPDIIPKHVQALAEVFVQEGNITNPIHEHDTEDLNSNSEVEEKMDDKHLTDVEEQVREHVTKSQKRNGSRTEGQEKTLKTKKQKQKGKQDQSIVSSVCKNGTRKKTAPASPQPGPSHSHIDDSVDTDTDEDEIDEKEKCCICKKYTPDAVRQSVSLIFVKWAQCDTCEHWVHLKYCSEVSFIRKGKQFFCAHCKN